MTEDAVEIDPFAPGTLDQETELAALTHAVEFARGFSLLFVLCNQAPQRRQLMAEVRARLPEFRVQEIHLGEPVPHLLDALRERLDSPLPNAVFVSGLEHSLPTVTGSSTTPFVANLNASRNSFPQTAPRPIVLWVPEYVLTAIAQGAPDFFSIRSGVYAFAAAPEDLAGFAQALSAGKNWQVASLPLAEKRDRVAAIEQLLTEYEALPTERRDHRTELRLLDRLGVLYRAQGNYVEALRQFQHGLKLANELGDRTGVAISLQHIGVLHLDRGDYQHALQCYLEAMQIFEEIGDHASIANSLGQIGVLYKNRGEYKQALHFYGQALRIFEELGDQAGIAITLHNMGVLQQIRGEYEQALRHYEQAMRISEEIGDRAGVASSLHMIGRLHQVRGEYREALQRYEESLQIKETLGDNAGTAISLSQIGKLYTENGRYEEAFSLLLNALDIFRQLQSPNAEIVETNLKSLRAQWGEQPFDAMWWMTKNEDVPSWLQKAEEAASHALASSIQP